MNISILDQIRKGQHTTYGEAVRLSNELRSKPASSFEIGGITYTIPAKTGFDCETAPYSDFTSWFNDITIKKSQSLFWFVIRIMAWRFPDKHTEIRSNLAERRRLEFDLILSQMKNEIEWVGTVGYQNMVRLDGSLTNPRTRIIKKSNDVYIVERK